MDDDFDPSDHRPYPFCNIYDLRRYHAYKRRPRLCTPPSDPSCSTSRTSSWNRGTFLAKLSEEVINGSKAGYPELEEKKEFIFKVLTNEENQFNKTIDQGLRILGEMEDEMKAVAGNYYPCTDDGTYGHAGMVTTMIEKLVNEGKKYDVCVAIGPMIMMKFVCLLTKKLGIHTIVSMNPIMVDGTGMCGACRLQVGDEIKFACVDGPEFDGHLVDFDQAMKRSQMYKTQEGRALLKLQEGDTHHGGCGHCGGDN